MFPTKNKSPQYQDEDPGRGVGDPGEHHLRHPELCGQDSEAGGGRGVAGQGPPQDTGVQHHPASHQTQGGAEKTLS